MYPPELLYTKDHECIRVDESVGIIGITDHAQKEFGDNVLHHIPNAVEHVSATEAFGSVESVKAVSEIFSLVTGVVTTANPILKYIPALINLAHPGDVCLIKVNL